jgi:multiple sugar transport system substrate-binding protein
VKPAWVWFFTFVFGVLLFALLWPRQATTPDEKRALAEGRSILVYWDRHSGHEHEARRKLIDEFNNSQDKVYIRALSMGYNASAEKLLTSIAGGTPPDICALDTSLMSELVTQGCFTPLDDFVENVPSLRREKFYPSCWDMVSFAGHVWGIPTTTDTYCLLWNKQAFRKAGLDPERPPKTLKELEEYAEKLTIQSSRGVEQIGFLPWQPWDMTTMWGLFFGATWYDYEKGVANCGNDPNIIKMFQWQQSFAINPNGSINAKYALDPEKIQSFQQGFGSYMSANNPFYSGKIAMIAEGEWQVTFIPKYAPDLDWGVAPLPVPEGCEPLAYGAPSVADCIPKGCKNVDAAKAYLKWFYSPRDNGGPSPVSDYDYAIHNLCPRIEDAKQERFISDPKFKVFVDVLNDRRVAISPVTPLPQYFGDEMERQRERVVFYKTTPEQAARELQEKVNRELDRARLFGLRKVP